MKAGFWSEARTIVALAVCLLTLAEIVDLTIVAVALPHIMGALSCNVQEISLVTTSYIVSAAVFIMLTGFVSKHFGSKKVILCSAVVFGVSSICCGFATSLTEMVFFRIVQGIGGAFLPSMAQGYITNNFDDEERPKMMSFLTFAMVLGPILGPILGGYLVQAFDWRWIFFVNVPICLTAFVIVFFYMVETPKGNVTFDALSFGFMGIGFGCLEYVIDEGNTLDWFNSHELIIILLTGLCSIGFFVWRGLRGKSVVNFKIFTNSNFVWSCVYVFTFMTLACVVIVFYPTLLQTGYGFPVDLAGYMSAPRGIFAVAGAGITMQLCKRFDKRKVLYFGLALFIGSNFMQAHYGETWNLWYHLGASALMGMGMSATFMVLLQVAFTGINESLSNDAAGVFNFFRNIGNSVGTSIASTMLSRQEQVSWNDLSAHINPFNHNWVHAQNTAFAHNSLTAQVQSIANSIQAQSFLIANIDVYHFAGWAALVLTVIPFFLAKPAAGIVEVHAH